MLKTLAGCQQGSSSSQAIESGVGSPSWTALKAQAYSVFETMQALLSVPSFVAVTQELLQHQVGKNLLQWQVNIFGCFGFYISVNYVTSRIISNLVRSCTGYSAGK